jgi:predicted metal-binding membrane protein
MNDEPTILGGSDVGVGKAAHLPLAVDRAAFQPELDSLGRSPALRVGMPGSSRMEIITPRRWQPLPDGPAASQIGGAKFASALGIAVATLGLAVACWFVSALQMSGMDMGVATRLGSFASFIGVWVTMMAAMMLPGAIPAIARLTHSRARMGQVAVFVGSYLTVWALVGAVVYAIYRPHGTSVAGVIVIAAGIYEVTPLKQYFRRECGEKQRSGWVFGLDCVGSSVGLMAILVVLGVMSVTWMAVIAVVVVAQKFLPVRALIDVPLALAIVGLGIVILAVPTSVPGLIPTASHMSVM